MRVFVISALVLFLLLLAGCEPGETVHFINETDQEIQIFYLPTRAGEEPRPDLVSEFLVSPRSELDVGSVALVEGTTVQIEARVDGRVIYREELTFEELKQREFRIRITPDMLPTPRADEDMDR